MKKKSQKSMINLCSYSQCPFCEGENTNYENDTVDAGVFTQVGRCYDCNKKWLELYHLKQVQ